MTSPSPTLTSFSARPADFVADFVPGADTILRGQADSEPTCVWCQRLIRVCDGTLTLADAAQRLHLPLKVCQKLAVRALAARWMELVVPGADSPSSLPAVTPLATPTLVAPANSIGTEFWLDLQQSVSLVLGASGPRLIERAIRMTRLEASQLTVRQIGELLIALELAASDTERDLLASSLDDLRQRYAA